MTTTDPVASMTTPKVSDLRQVLRDCGPVANGVGVVETADAIRFNRWAGQTPDGKKADQPGKPAFPFAGAADGQPLLADAIIEERSAVLVAAFWRAAIKPKSSTDEAGGYAVKLIEHILNRDQAAKMYGEVALAANHLDHYGAVVLHPYWEQRVSKKRVRVTLEEVVALSQAMLAEDPTAMVVDVGVAISDPEQEGSAVAAMTWMYKRLAAQRQPQQIRVEIPEPGEAVLRKAVRALRKDGFAYVPVPYLASNQPAVCVLKLNDDVFVPGETEDVNRARVVFHREFLTQAELKAKATEGWKADFIEAALKTAGQTFQVLDAGQTPAGVAAAIGRQGVTNGIAPSELIEVFHACYQATDEDGVPAVYQTTFSYHVKDPDEGDLFAVSQILDYTHGELPYVGGKMEWWARQFMASRGVPEIVRTWQQQVKALDDAVIDFTSIAVMPPVNIPKTPLGTNFRFGPAVRNEVMPGKEPQFMQIPNSGVPYALTAREGIEKRVANRFGLMSETVPPPRWQLSQGVRSTFFLLMWSAALQQIAALSQQYMTDAQFAEITGAPLGWLDARRDHMAALSVSLSFDVRDLDPELTISRLKAISELVLPLDVNGLIDRNALVGKVLRAVSPEWVSDLVMPAGAASEKVWNQVSDDIAKMYLGNEVRYVENDPTAGAKMQYAQRIVQANPNYTAGLQQGGRFAELMDKYQKNLTFSVQQAQNRQVGRIGVQPEGMA